MPLYKDANEIVINQHERINIVGATITKTRNPTAWIRRRYTITLTPPVVNAANLDFSTVPEYASIDAAVNSTLAAGKLFKLADNNVNGLPKQLLYLK